jgi:hypothetical protein
LSLRELSRRLAASGTPAGRRTIRRLLRQLGLGRRTARKKKTMGHHPDRNAQFENIARLRREYLDEELKATIERLLSSEHLPVRRTMDEGKTKFKNVDVRRFLKSIKLEDGSIMVECEISPAGSVRVEEVLNLLGLDEGKLAAPIRRTNVRWQSN